MVSPVAGSRSPDASGLGGGSASKPSRRTNIIAYFLHSGSPRVFNCLRLARSVVDATPEGQKPQLLFQTPILNKIVIFKDLHSTDSGYSSARAVRVGTKIYLPFDEKRLDDGGLTFFFDRREFMKMLGEFVDLSNPVARETLSADVRILEVLDALPTFAPFLVRDSFEQSSIVADPLYVAIPESEWEEIRAFIRDRFRQILAAVGGGGKVETQDALNRLLDKLWDMTDVPVLESLAVAFGLPKAGCMERFYAWKGTLYFCWAFETLQKAIFEMGSWLNDWPRLVSVYPPPVREGAKAKFQALHTELFQQLRGVEVILSEYERAFNDLFVHNAGPQRFIRYLTEAPTKFSDCGTGIGILQHAHEMWDRLTEPFPNRQASYTVLDEVIYAVDSVLTRPV
jgi:hypothetical protein